MINTHVGAPVHRGWWEICDINRAPCPRKTTTVRRNGGGQGTYRMEVSTNHNIPLMLWQGKICTRSTETFWYVNKVIEKYKAFKKENQQRATDPSYKSTLLLSKPLEVNDGKSSPEYLAKPQSKNWVESSLSHQGKIADRFLEYLLR